MLPFQAQGAAMAIEDAAILAPLLMTEPDATSAFKRFAAMRRPRVERVRKISDFNGFAYHMEWPFTLGRDAVICGAGAARATSSGSTGFMASTRRPEPPCRAVANASARGSPRPGLALALDRAGVSTAGLATSGSSMAADRKNSPLTLICILVTILLDMVGYGIIVPVLPELIKELTGGGVAEAAVFGGWLVFVYASMQFLFSPVLGNLSDHFGRRPRAARLAPGAHLRLRR